jgi:hypothetical protein
VTLFNGGESSIFTGATASCVAVFNSSLDCDASVQLLSYDLSYLQWAESNLTTLCTSSCESSLIALASSVQACGDYSFDFNNGNLTAVQVVDLYLYKYNTSCVTDAATGAFCLIESKRGILRH